MLSLDGRLVLPGGTTYRNGTQLTTRAYLAETGAAAGPVLDPGGILRGAGLQSRRLMRGDRLLVRADGPGEGGRAYFEQDGKAGSVQVWDWKTGKRLANTVATPSEPRGLAFRPDGSMLAAVCDMTMVILIDPGTGGFAATSTRGCVRSLSTRISGGATARPASARTVGSW